MAELGIAVGAGVWKGRAGLRSSDWVVRRNDDGRRLDDRLGRFIVAADISRQTGSAAGVIFAWIITGFLTIAAALSFGELAALFPRAGGQYVYLREAYSPLWGFLYGWTLFPGHSNGNYRGGRDRLLRATSAFVSGNFPASVDHPSN